MRINMSYPAAEAYVEQFPKEKTAQVARYILFQQILSSVRFTHSIIADLYPLWLVLC